MKTGNRLLALSLGGLSLAANANSPRAGEPAALTMSPMQAQSLDVGPKHVVTYFLAGDDHCRLTLMIVDAGDDAYQLASRIQLAVDSGGTARLDTMEGASLAFACDNGAQAMRVTRIERAKAAPGIE